MSAPVAPPVGLQLARTAKAVNRAFDAALAAAGGSLSRWLILISVKSRTLGNQRELADAIGIRGATLTHHLNAMETAGLVTRHHHPDNRRTQRVELTEAGEAAFARMRTAAAAFDRRLRTGLSSDDAAALTRLLDLLDSNVVR